MTTGCFGWVRVRRVSPKEPLISSSSSEPELYDTDAADESYFGHLSSFAEVKVTSSRRHRSPSQQQVCTMKVSPYFGPYAGSEVTFTVCMSAGQGTRTQVQVGGAKICTRLNFAAGSRESLRDACINFVHDDRWAKTDIVAERETQPNSLKFLCTKRIHLRGVLPAGMPMREAKKFDRTTKQEVFVRVWPSQLPRTRHSCGFGAEKDAIKLRVPMHISFAELAWYVRDKLGLPLASGVGFREPNSLEDVQPTRPLMLGHTLLECFVTLPQTARTAALRLMASVISVRLPVSLIGSGVEEVVVTPTMTVAEFEVAVLQQFGLGDDCFLYIPALFSHQCSHPTGLKMYATANRRSVISLVDRHARRFPIISDNDPNLAVEHRELPLYSRTVREAGLLKESPLLCFDVTGPTIPLKFKGMSNIVSGVDSGSSSSTNESSDRSSNFAHFSVENRVLSINPNWTAATLLKFVECISRFPCRRIVMGEDCAPNDAIVASFFNRDWIVRDPRGRYALSPKVLRVTP